jgi:putative flippase GtrA
MCRMSDTASPASGSAGRASPPEGPARAGPAVLTRYPKFLLVGLTGVVVNLATFVLTVDAIAHSPTSNLWGDVVHFASKTAPNPLVYLAASAVAFAVATIWNFALNSWWTFRPEGEHRHSPARRLGLYYGVSLGSLAVNEAVLLATQAVLPPLFGQGLGVVAGSVVGFLGNNRYTFAERDTA